MTAARRPRTLAASAALAVAVAVAFWSGQTVQASTEPTVDAALGPGDSAVVEGLRIRFDHFESRTSVPPKDPTVEAWTAPPGAVALLVHYTVELADPSATGSDILCGAALRRGDTSWGVEGAVWSNARSEAVTSCVPYGDDWASDPRRPRAVVLAFVVPASQVAGVEARLDFWYEERTVIALRAEAPPAPGGPATR